MGSHRRLLLSTNLPRRVAWAATAGLLLALAPLATAQAVKQDAKPAENDKQAEESVELPARLIERSPFDRITLNAQNGRASIDTVLLDLPDRKVPNPLPKTGSLSLRRLSHPSIAYSVEWSAIEKVELYEQLLLAESERLTAAGNFAEAFEYLAFLATNYPQLEGLGPAMENHLWKEASATYAAKKRDEAWPILQALYLRNPRYPRLVNAVQAVSDELITVRLKDKNYSAARSIVDELEKAFPELGLANIARWRGQFQSDAQAQMTKARAAFAAQNYSEARDALTFARSILPTIEGGEELWKQIQGTAPEVRVGVTQAGAPPPAGQTPAWAAARIRDLVDPRLMHIVGFGAEGGVYGCPFGEVQNGADGLTTTVRLSAEGLNRGLSPETLALRLIEMASSDDPRREEDFAALVDKISVIDGRDVQIKWRQPYIRPQALLEVPLRWLTAAANSPGLWFDSIDNKSGESRYQRTGQANSSSGEPRYIVEKVYADDEAAIDALTRGDVDAIDRVPPWQVVRLKGAPDIVVDAYRLPTVHVLIPNLSNPLLESRDFRRAICYGIDADGILRDLVLGGQESPGFQKLSGPFPAGVALNDPVGYAYNVDILPRPYEPRLASLLAIAARTAIVKQEAERKKAESAAREKDKPKDAKPPAPEKPAEPPAAAAKPVAAAADDPDALPKLQPLVLAFPSDPLARLACQSIKLQLEQIGIPIKLSEFAAAAPPPKLKYDLLYAEFAVWEPIADARGLLGPGGVASRSSALMALALDDLPHAENWNQARAKLNEIHRIAHYDLPLIPLWQTVNSFAYRKSISGVGNNPVTLYQNVSAWKKSFQ